MKKDPAFHFIGIEAGSLGELKAKECARTIAILAMDRRLDRNRRKLVALDTL